MLSTWDVIGLRLAPWAYLLVKLLVPICTMGVTRRVVGILVIGRILHRRGKGGGRALWQWRSVLAKSRCILLRIFKGPILKRGVRYLSPRRTTVWIRARGVRRC